MWRTLLSLLLITITQPLVAQLRFAYYDVDRLYDTEPSLFYDDTEFTPEGRYKWDSTRYERKVNQVVAVIDSLRCDAVALYGVESEQVVRDIALRLQGDYTYLHRTINSFDGMDFALLYLADRLEPLHAEAQRAALIIEALISRDTVNLVLCSDSRFADLHIEELIERHPERGMLVAGKLYNLDATAYGLHDCLAAAARRGQGNRIYRGRWRMRDRIFTRPPLDGHEGAVVIRREWLDERTAEPLPTYRGNRYTKGVGAYLPIWCEIE